MPGAQGGDRQEVGGGAGSQDSCRGAQTNPAVALVASQGGSWVTKVTAGPGASCSKQTSKTTHPHLRSLLVGDHGHFQFMR